MKNLKICSVIFLVAIGWWQASFTYIANLQNKLGYINKSTGVLNYSHESAVLISNREQVFALVSVLLWVALIVFGRRASREGSGVGGRIFIYVAILGLMFAIFIFMVSPLNTIYIG